MYLLDTDILNNLLKRVPSPRLVATMASVPQEQQFTSSITLGELVYGAHRRKEHQAALLQRINQLLLVNQSILPLDAPSARRCGEVRAQLEEQGLPIGDADLRIASIALARGLIVVTGNVRHFQRIPGLAVENWLE